MRIFVVTFLATLLLTSCATAQTNQRAFRVLSYNIHHGEGMDGKIDLKRIADFIKETKADIVGLQEVDRGVERTARQDFPKELAKLTGMKVYFERNIIYQGGDYGNAVLTKFPIKKKKNTHYKMLREGEQRGVLQTVLDVHGKDVLFMTTHIDYRPEDDERLINADELKKIVVDAGKMPVILCGDFNDSPKSRTHQKIETFLDDTWLLVGQGNGFTIPVAEPNNRIDYIWISKENIEPLKIEVPKTDVSDHLPVLGEFRLR